VTLPTSDAHSSHPQSDHSHSTPPPAFPPSSSPASMSIAGRAGKISAQDDSNSTDDFTASSWDLATGSLRALTAKREIPYLIERRGSGKLPKMAVPPPRNYLFTVVILTCLLVMLISGGVILFLLMQP
jgi:hypothetical protein